MPLTSNPETEDPLSILFQKVKAIITVNDESLRYIVSRKGHNVIVKCNYRLEMSQSSPLKKKKIGLHGTVITTHKEEDVQLITTKKTRAVNDIIKSWVYSGEAMTKEVIAFHDFINLRVRKFEDLLRLHGDYRKLYDKYSQALTDKDQSRAAVLGLLRNVERVQMAVGQVHEQVIDVKNTVQEDQDVIECLKTVSGALKTLERKVPNIELFSTKKTVKFVDCRSLSCKETIQAPVQRKSTLQTYIIENKLYFIFDRRREKDIILWDASNKSIAASLGSRFGIIYTFTVYKKNNAHILASASNNKTIKLWNLSSRSLVKSLSGHNATVESLTAYEENGRTILISGSRDNTIKLWDVAEFTCIRTFYGHKGVIKTLCTYNLCGSFYLASGSKDKTIKIWCLAKHALVKTFRDHQSFVYSLAVTEREGQIILASGGFDGEVRIWDLNNQTCIKSWRAGRGAIVALQLVYSNGKPCLVCGDSLGQKIKIYNLDDHVLQTELECDGSLSSIASCNIEGKPCLLSVCNDGKIQSWMEKE